MRKLMSMLLMGLLGLLLIVFLVSNLQPVLISLDPFSQDDPAFAIGPMPLWVAMAITLFIGYFLGAMGMWMSGKSTRKKASAQKKEIKQMKMDAEASANPVTGQTLPAIRR